MRMVKFYRHKQFLIPAHDESTLDNPVDRTLVGKPNYNLKRDMGSINKAKRESRVIQLANGGLGAGSVQVIR